MEPGLTWPEKWNYKPGGPWVYTASPCSDERDKIWAKASGAAHSAWIKGWEDGRKTAKSFLSESIDR